MHRGYGPINERNGIDKATLAARLLGHCRREPALPLFWGKRISLSPMPIYLIEAQRWLHMVTDDNGYELCSLAKLRYARGPWCRRETVRADRRLGAPPPLFFRQALKAA